MVSSDMKRAGAGAATAWRGQMAHIEDEFSRVFITPSRARKSLLVRCPMHGQGVFQKVSLFIARKVAIGGLRAHSKSKSVSPVCRLAVTGRVVFSTQFQLWNILEEEFLYELDDQRPSS
jgi:hypothetical protein